MLKDLVIVGCGGLGREVHDVVDAINAVTPTWNVLGYIDDSPSDTTRLLTRGRGFEILGGIDVLASIDAAYFVIGIGSGEVREMLDGALTAAGWQAATLMHPTGSLGYDVILGPGTVIYAGTRFTTHIRTGRHVHVNASSTVGHDAVFADYVTINPQVAVSGNVQVGARTTLGTKAAILQGIEIGHDSFVGAGAVVVKPVASGVVVKGVPAK